MPDAEADHRHEERRDRVDVGEARENEEQQERGQQRRERQRDRDHPRDERAEDHEQHDQRGEEAEQLLRSLLDRRELGVAVELHDHACRLHVLADFVLNCEDGLAILVEDHAVELRLRVGDAAVVGDRALVERVADALDARLVLGRLELGGLELRDRPLDRRPALGRVELLPYGSGEDDVQHTALLGGELGLDQVGRLLRVGAGDVELVLQAAADRRDEHDQEDHDPDPAEDHPPGVRGAHARPAGEPAGCEPFVRCLSCWFQIVLRHGFHPSGRDRFAL